MIGSISTQPSGAVSKLAARQTLPCQPLFVRPGQGRLSRAIIRTRAEEGEKGEKPDLKGFFTGSSNASRGYTEEDSAGQSNIFAVEPKQYVAGSQKDQGANSNTLALVLAGLGVAILVVGLLALRGEKPASSVAVKELRKEVTRYRTLGELKDQLAVVSAPSLASDGVQS